MGGAAGAALIGGLTSGFVQGRRQAEEQSVQNEYKKVLMNQAKMNIEMAEQKWNAMKRFQQTGDPMDAMMAGIDTGKMDEARIMKGLFPDQVTPQQPQTNIGMNYEEPTTPQVTFNGGLTGVPRINFDNLTPHQKGFLNKKWGLFDFEKVTGAREATVDGQSGIQYYGPNGPVTFQPTDSPVEYVKGPPINGIEHEYAVHKVTKQPMNPMFYPPKPLATEIKYQEVTNPDKSKSLKPVPRFANPQGGMGTPSQAIGMPKPGQPIQFDNKETLDEYVKTFGSGGRSGGGIQTEPAQNDMVIPTEKLGDYYNPVEGKFLSEHPEAGAMTQNKRLQLGYKEVPKLGEEQKGRFSGAVIALDEMLPRVYKEMFPGGKFSAKVHNDVKKIASSNKMLNELGGGTVGEAVYKDLIESAEAWVRSKTGAAMNDAEIEQAAKTFVGQWLSNSSTVKRGLDNLKSLLEGFAKSHDPKGVYRDIETRKETVVDGKTYIRLKGQWFEKR